MSNEMILGYWNFTGYAHSIRLLLKYANANYKEQMIDENAMDTWLDLKSRLEVDFPNLPYLFDGDIKLSQSVAILRHLGRKFNLQPETAAEHARVDVLQMQIVDWRAQSFALSYGPKEQFEKKTFRA